MSQAAPRIFGPDPLYERWRWQIFGITWLAYAGFYLTRKSFSIAKIELAKPEVFGLSREAMSWIDGGWLVAYAMGMMLAGICGDRFGTRKVIVVGMIGSVLSALAMSVATTMPALLLGSTLLGLFQSCGWAPLSKNLTNFFSRRERGAVMGVWCTNYALGGWAAGIYAGWIGDSFGWRAAFYLPALTTLGILGLFILLQRNRPEDVGLPPIEVYHDEIAPADVVGTPAATSAATASEQNGSWKTVLAVLANPMVLLLSAIYFCLKPTRYAILLWGPKYINERLGSGMAGSGLISGMFEFAGPLGVILGGILSDRAFGSRRMPVAIICLFLLGGLLLCLDHLPHTAWMLGGGLYLLGFLTYAPDSLVAGTAAVDFGTKRGASTASGVINSAGSFGAVLGGTLPGLVHERWGWDGIFIALACAVFLAAVMLLPQWNALPADRMVARELGKSA